MEVLEKHWEHIHRAEGGLNPNGINRDAAACLQQRSVEHHPKPPLALHIPVQEGQFYGTEADEVLEGGDCCRGHLLQCMADSNVTDP